MSHTTIVLRFPPYSQTTYGRHMAQAPRTRTNNRIAKLQTPRHGFTIDRIPTTRGPVWGGSTRVYTPQDYAAIIDTAFEMADDISNGNGVTPQQALQQVIKDEGFHILPTHQRLITDRLSQP